MSIEICYKDYVNSAKACQKTTDPEEVTCKYCKGRLISQGKLETKRTDSEEEDVES